MKKKRTRRKARKQIRYLRWIVQGTVGFLLITSATVAAIGITLNWWATKTFASELKSPEALMNSHTKGVTLLDRNGRVFFTFYNPERRTPVALSNIAPAVTKALIASEDRNFYREPGFSVPSIAQSFVANAQSGTITRGGSTITQQLVKITLLSPQRSYIRKLEEITLAYELNRSYSKDQILTMYLNSAYFGNGAYGIEQAAQTYFGKHANELNTAQAAVLIGVLPSPSALAPTNGNGDAAIKRSHEVLQAMYDTGAISAEDRKAAAEEAVTFETAPDIANMNTLAPHFALYVRQQLIDQFGEDTLARSGFTVKTTLDLTEQAFAEETVAKQVKLLESHKVSNGAAVVEDVKTGEILAMVGSRDWQWPGFGTFNVAAAQRQPGSSFKPIVYSLALDKKLITPATMLHDVPTRYRDQWGNTYEPHNYDNKYRGNVTVRRALANSLNLPAVEVMNKLPVSSVTDWAKQLGISTLEDPSHYGLSLVLGAAEVTPIELTNVYATFADDGQYHTPTSILEIHDMYGKPVATHADEPRQAVSPQVAFLINAMLSDNAARRETFGTALTINRPAMAKTGTTNDYKDAWTLGATPSRAVGVWVGNNDGTPMDKVAGSLGAAPIWRAILEHASQGQASDGFAPPDGVAHGSLCSGQAGEWFIKGTEPTKACPPPPPPDQPADQSNNQPQNSPNPSTQPSNQPAAPPSSAPTIQQQTVVPSADTTPNQHAAEHKTKP